MGDNVYPKARARMMMSRAMNGATRIPLLELVAARMNAAVRVTINNTKSKPDPVPGLEFMLSFIS